MFSNRAIQPAQIVTQTTVVSGSRTCCRCNKRMPEHLPGCYKLVTAQDVVPRSVQPRIILNVAYLTKNVRRATEDKLIMYTCQCETWIQAQVP